MKSIFISWENGYGRVRVRYEEGNTCGMENGVLLYFGYPPLSLSLNNITMENQTKENLYGKADLTMILSHVLDTCICSQFFG